MIPPSVAVLFAVAGCRFYQPTSAEVEDCEKLAALGYIQPAKQGKLDCYAMALEGTKFVRSYMGYER